MAENGQSDVESLAGGEGSATRRLARIYAEALLDAAETRDMAASIGDELQAVENVFKTDPRIEQLYTSPIIKRSTKEELLARAFEGRVSDLFFDFLRVLNRKGRLGLLVAIAVAYSELLDKRAKRIRVLVRTAVPLGEDQQHLLQEMLRNSLHKEPILNMRVDPDVLGGMVVQVGDDVFDASVRTRIETLRKKLLASSSHEIQVGRNRFSH